VTVLTDAERCVLYTGLIRAEQAVSPQRLSEVTLISVVLMQIEEYLTTGTLQALSPEEDAKKAKEKQEAAAEVEKSAAYAFL